MDSVYAFETVSLCHSGQNCVLWLPFHKKYIAILQHALMRCFVLIQQTLISNKYISYIIFKPMLILKLLIFFMYNKYTVRH